MKDKNLKKIIIFGILFFIFFLIFYYRHIYLKKFDEKYARNLYDHSQYRIPRSPRSISDELLYQVAGVDYLRTGNIFNINPEAPPFAKYLYGLSIFLFKNAQIISLPILLLCLLFYFKILKTIFKKDDMAIFSGLLLFTFEPLIFSQISISMLDLPQLLFFLIYIYLTINILKNRDRFKNLFLSIFSGISLGLFISTKTGFLPYQLF